jgi:hypothetical protein
LKGKGVLTQKSPNTDAVLNRLDSGIRQNDEMTKYVTTRHSGFIPESNQNKYALGDFWVNTPKGK